MNTNEKSEGPTQMETLLGGIELTVEKLDRTTETVRVRQLPVKLYPQYLLCMEDEPAMVELFCDRKAGWSEGLAPQSFQKVVEEGERINADFFESWYRRKIARLEKLVPGARDRILTEASRLQSGSPSSPSNAGLGSATPATIPSPS